MNLAKFVEEGVPGLKFPVACRFQASNFTTDWSKPELVDVARNSENWNFTHTGDKASYTDVAIVAQLHSLIGKRTEAHLPRFDQVPAFRKLGDQGLTPEQSQEVLNESHHQIEDLKAILSADIIPVLK